MSVHTRRWYEQSSFVLQGLHNTHAVLTLPKRQSLKTSPNLVEVVEKITELAQNINLRRYCSKQKQTQPQRTAAVLDIQRMMNKYKLCIQSS